MSSQNNESPRAEDRAPELELNKETLQDLDLEPADASDVKGGGVSIPASTGRTATRSVGDGGDGTTTGASIVVHP